MSCDIERLQSAASLRAWEEGRAKNFASWRLSVEAVIAGLQQTVGLGIMQQQRTEEFLQLRCRAEQAYSQRLLGHPNSLPSSPSAATSNGKSKETASAGSSKSKS